VNATIDLAQRRAVTAQQFTDGVLDVLVVGGGIVGAGILRDAAMRGLRGGLIEQSDLAFGTSSRSSRLLHGGLRYLAQGRLGLVYEASREKRVLHRIAPHLAAPLPFLFPTYSGTSWPRWQLRIGVKIYDLLCGGRNLGQSQGLSPAEMVDRLPQVDPRGLTGGVRYFDGLTNDARLVIDTLRSASRHGGPVWNYARLVSAQRQTDHWTCEVHDALSDRSVTLSARCVVNATGPWSSSVPHSSIALRLTKGVHLVIDRSRLNVPDAVVMTDGPRILFAIPWGERVILGTTDTDYGGALDDVRASPEDVDEVLSVVNRAFPPAEITRDDVLSTWAGLRPLIADPGGQPSDISRRHEIRMPQPGWLDVAGGKLTTYRHIAQQAVDRLVQHLGRDVAPCRTADEPLLESGAAVDPGGSAIVPPPVEERLVWEFCQRQWAVHLDDVLLRRTSWHYYRHDAAAVAQQVAGWMAAIFGWDAARRDSELARYKQIVAGAG